MKAEKRRAALEERQKQKLEKNKVRLKEKSLLQVEVVLKVILYHNLNIQSGHLNKYGVCSRIPSRNAMTQPSTGQPRRPGLKSASRDGRGEARSATSPDKKKVRGLFFVSNLNILPAVNKKIIKTGGLQH